MTDTIKRSWLALSEHKLTTLLTKKEYPIPLIKSILANVRQIKAQRKSESIRATVAYQLWDDVLAPAREELGTLRVLKTQTKKLMPDGVDNPSLQIKYDALCAYEVVLVKVITRLRKIQREGEVTPLQLGRALRDVNKMPTAGAGDHWTHYVQPSDRREVERMFVSYPQPPRGKKKVPFEMKIGKHVHDRQRRKIVGQLSIDQAQAEQEYEMTTDPDEQERLNKRLQDIHWASYKLDTLPRTAPLPASWEGLLNLR